LKMVEKSNADARRMKYATMNGLTHAGL